MRIIKTLFILIFLFCNVFTNKNIDDIITIAYGDLNVYVYNEVGIELNHLKKVNFIILKNGRYYLSNKELGLLGVYSENSHSIKWFRN